MRQNDADQVLPGDIPAFDGAAALGRFREHVRATAIVPRRSWTDAVGARLSLASLAWTRAALAAIAVVAIAIGAAATGVADTVLTVFEPKQIQPVNVSATDLQGLRGIPDPSAYGTLHWIAQPVMRPAADAAAAASAAGFAPLQPTSLPAGVPATPAFSVLTEGKATFQFDAAKASAAAAKVNATIPPMPASVAATTLTMSGGPAILTQYGGTLPSEGAGTRQAALPRLFIVQAKAPVVTSNGASVDELRDYALRQPGIPPSLAAQIRAIGDPVRTMLVPTGLDTKDAKAVTVRGTQGYFIGDSTGLGSGIVWLERGYVIEVAGSLTEAELIALANGLH